MGTCEITSVLCRECGEIKDKRGFHLHLKSHNMTATEYADKYNDFSIIKEPATTSFIKIPTKCLICGQSMPSEKYLSYHLRNIENIEKLEYIKKYVFNNEPQYCKCGCGNEVNIILQPPYRRDVISGHNINPMLGKKHSIESKKQMSISAQRRISQDLENNITPAWHDKNAIIKRGDAYSITCMTQKLKKYDITFINDKKEQREKSIYKWKCNKCGDEYIQYHSSYFTCKKCNPYVRSKQQEDVFKYVKSIWNGDVIQNYRKFSSGKYEIDIFIPELNIGIEYNGLYWHSELNISNKNYHLDKLKFCEDKNIHLISIFEDEWIHKQDIIKQRLYHIIVKEKSKIYARQCIIKEISSIDKKQFLLTNHLQGDDKSKVRLGAFYNDKLIACMTFGKFRISLGRKNESEYEYELLRFASNQNIVGIASKLFSHFIKNYNPTRIISYADRKWTTTIRPSVYDIIGFKQIGNTPPNYWYFEVGMNTRHHRFTFRKSELVRMGHDKNKTEPQIMSDLGYARIWDCGSLKYEFNINEINVSI